MRSKVSTDSFERYLRTWPWVLYGVIVTVMLILLIGMIVSFLQAV
jgi:hypothetical protein